MNCCIEEKVGSKFLALEAYIQERWLICIENLRYANWILVDSFTPYNNFMNWWGIIITLMSEKIEIKTGEETCPQLHG